MSTLNIINTCKYYQAWLYNKPTERRLHMNHKNVEDIWYAGDKFLFNTYTPDTLPFNTEMAIIKCKKGKKKKVKPTFFQAQKYNYFLHWPQEIPQSQTADQPTAQ